ncbi:hypothetical protein IMZ48_49695 [Candidatus Bathyarchaeota archaeon]|nr:hypothetical protein [Candidatus Bathyarchaeota archaeon]
MPNEYYRGIRSDDETKHQKMVPLPEGEPRTTSELVNFADQPASLALPHLIGCTSIIVVSNKGAWANHIWEMPGFTAEKSGDWDENDVFTEDGGYMHPGTAERVDEFPTEEQLEYFQAHAIKTLHTQYDGDSEGHASGLDDLRGEGNMFEDNSYPKVFMFIPYARNSDVPAWDKGGRPSPRGDDGTTSFNDQIRGELKKIFGDNLQINEVLYRTAANVDSEEYDAGDTTYTNTMGRALVQYQPGDGSDCDNSKAKWRIFFEGNQEAHSTDGEWDPEDKQWCLASGNKRRQACEPTDEPEEDEPEEDEPEEDEPEKDEPEEDEEDEPEGAEAPWEAQDKPACHNEDDFPGHAYITPGQVTLGTLKACGAASGSMGETSARKPPFTLRHGDSDDINYDYTIQWKDGCQTKLNTQDMQKPLGEDGLTCGELMMKTFTECEY